MGIKRAARPGQTVRVPILSDTVYQYRRAQAVLGAGGRQAQEAELLRIMESEDLYAETLDASVLVVPVDGVAHATIRGLSGQAFEDADARVPRDLLRDPARAHYRREAEVVAAGLVSLDVDGGESGTVRDGLYDVAALADDCRSLWPDIRAELARRIRTLSHLGPLAGSSCAPSCDEPTRTTQG